MTATTTDTCFYCDQPVTGDDDGFSHHATCAWQDPDGTFLVQSDDLLLPPQRFNNERRALGAADHLTRAHPELRFWVEPA